MLDLIFEALADLFIRGTVAAATYALVSLAVNVFLDEKEVRKTVSKKCPEALKAVIQEKKKNAIKVGIYKNNDREISSEMEITTSKGVSDNLHVGKIIMLQ